MTDLPEQQGEVAHRPVRPVEDVAARGGRARADQRHERLQEGAQQAQAAHGGVGAGRVAKPELVRCLHTLLQSSKEDSLGYQEEGQGGEGDGGPHEEAVSLEPAVLTPDWLTLRKTL